MMRALRSCAFVLVVAMAVAGCGSQGVPASAGGSAGGGGGAAPGPLPPVGSVWFGSAFDPATLAVSDRATSMKAGAPIVAVGHFLQAKPAEDMTVVIQRAQSTVARLSLPAGEPAKAFGIDLTAEKLTPGVYLVNFVDKNRRTLAAGRVTITQ